MEFHVHQSPEAHYTVYKLTSPCGKIYIGCTGMEPKKRWKNGKGYSNNTQLHTDIERFGWESFTKEILCEKLTKEGAEKLEKQFVDLLDARDPKKGYNIFAGGSRIGADVSTAGRQHMKISKIKYVANNPDFGAKIAKSCLATYSSPEYREKMRQRTREYIERNGGMDFRKPVPVICIETGKWYPSLCAAGRDVGVTHRTISLVCAGVYYSAGGYHWRYA